MRRHLTALSVITATACSNPATPLAPADAEPHETPLVLTSATPMGVAPRVLAVEGVPSYDAAPATGGTRDASDAANLAGLERHEQKDWAGAARHFIDALTIDPTSIVARYNLACVLALAGDARAKAVLTQLAAIACPKCLWVVAASQGDPDLASLKTDLDVVQLRKSATEDIVAVRWAGSATRLEDGGKRVVWRSLAGALEASEGLDVRWAEPAQVRALRILGPTFTRLSLAVAADGWPTTVIPFHLYEDPETLALEPSPITTHLRIMVTASSFDAPNEPVTFEVLGVQPPPADASPAPPPSPLAVVPAPITFEPGKVAFARRRLPLISVDGKHVAFFDDWSFGDFATLRISDVTSDTEIGSYDIVSKNDEPDLDAATAAKLAALGPWQPMLPIGGLGHWTDTSRDVSGVYAGANGNFLSVASIDGTLSFRRRGRPRYERTSRVEEAPSRLASSTPMPDKLDPFDLGWSYEFDWIDGWIDQARTTLYLLGWSYEGLCHLVSYDYRTIRLPK